MADSTSYARYSGLVAGATGVTSLNGLMGALSLTSTGSTVTITPSGSTIDLEVPAGGGLTLGAFGSTPNANGLSLAAGILNMQPADATHPGGISVSDWNTFNNKLTSTLTSGDIFVGNGSNIATGVAVSGDASLTNAGAFTVTGLQTNPVNSIAPTTGYILTWDGSQWSPIAGINPIVGVGLTLWPVQTNIITGPTTPTSVATLLANPTVSGPTTSSIVVNNSTLLIDTHIYNTALGVTSLPSGAWAFNMYASTSATGGVPQLIVNIVKVVAGAGTVTVSGSGTTRTVTTTSSMFVAGDFNASIILTSYVQVPGGIFPVASYSSGTSVTITTPAGYVNDGAGSAYSAYRVLFGDAITLTSTSSLLYAVSNAQPAFTINSTDKIAAMFYGKTTAATNHTITYFQDGNTANSSIGTTITGVGGLGAGVVRSTAAGVLSSAELSGDVSTSGTNATSLIATSNSTLTTISSLVSVGTITTGTWSATTIAATHGGTAQSTYATGDTIYASNTNTLSKLAIGSTGNVLTVSGGVPTWAAPATSGTVTSVALTVPSSSLFGVTGSPVTSSGTLGLTTAGTSGGIPYFSSTSQLNSSALLVANGLVLGGGAGTAPLTLATNASTVFPLVSGGTNTAPSWAGLTVPGGGTGLVSTTAYAVLCGGTTSTGALQSVASVGTSAQVLTSNGAGALPTFQTAAAALTSPYELINAGFSCTASTNILTFALKQSDGATDPSTGTAAVKVAMRSGTAATGGYNERSITAALSQTFTRKTSLGLGAQAQDLYLYLIDSDGAGTMKLGASAVLYDESALQTTVAESFSATATNATPCVFTANAHGMTNNDAVIITGTQPTGFSLATVYYVVAKATNTFELSATPGGSAIASSSTGSSIVIHYCGYKMASDAVYTSAPVRCVGKINETFATIGDWVAINSAAVVQKIPTRQDISAWLTNSATTISSSVATITWTNITKDILNAVPGKSVFIVPIGGTYSITAALVENATYSANNVNMVILQNGSIIAETSTVTAAFAANMSFTVEATGFTFTQNDLITIQTSNAGTGPTITSDTGRNYFSITKTGN